jgi:hypothetical protein
MAWSRRWRSGFSGSLDLHGWSVSGMNVQFSTCDGLLAPYRWAEVTFYLAKALGQGNNVNTCAAIAGGVAGGLGQLGHPGSLRSVGAGGRRVRQCEVGGDGYGIS